MRLGPHRGKKRGLCVLLALAACTPPAPVEPPVAPPEDIADDDGGTPQTAGFRYHPKSPSTPRDGWPLPDGSWLMVGPLGERWLTDPRAKGKDDSGKPTFDARASEHRAPEGLVAVARLPGDRGWMFLDEGGGVYTSLEPLGPLTARGRAATPLIALGRAGAMLLGADTLGDVVRWHDDQWQRVTTPAPLYDLAGASDGTMFGLAFPEKLYSSRDGQSWTRHDLPTVGATAIEATADGTVVIAGARGASKWSRGAIGPAVPNESIPTRAVVTLEARRGPRVSAVSEQNATLSGDRYVEVQSVDGGLALVRGRLGGDLKTEPLSLDDACQNRIVAAAGKHVALLCGTDASGSIAITLYRSADGGAHFEKVAELQSATPAFAGAALAADGTLLLTGMCRRDKCDAAAPLIIAPGKKDIVASHASDLFAEAHAPAFSPDGKHAYFFGKRGKDRQRALFVSHDGGKRFDARALTPPPRHRGRWMGSAASRRISVEADGTLGLLLDDYPLTYAVADSEGRITALAELPEQTKALDGYGRHLLALTQRTDPERPAIAELWESTDGGASFRQVIAPMNLWIDEFDHVGVRCSSAGCIIGDRVTRLGWDTPIGAPAVAGSTDSAPRPDLRTPVSCVAAGEWQTVDSVVAIGEGHYLPIAHEMMRGATLWAILRHDDRSGEVSAVSRELHGADAKLSHHVLMKAVGEKQRASYAYSVSAQMEGFEVMRVKLPKGERTGAAMRDIEIAWINYILDEKPRAVVEDAGPFGSEDVTPGQKPALLPALESVSPHAFLFRPSEDRADTFALDHTGNEIARGEYPSWPPTFHSKVIGDAVVSRGAAFAVGRFFETGQYFERTIALAPFGGDATFIGVAPADNLHEVTTAWTYSAGEIGIAVSVADTGQERSRSWFSGFHDDKTLRDPVWLPTQADIGDRPKACGEERRVTPREVARWLTGTRRAVLVTGLDDVAPLLTTHLVLHGTPEAPCVAAWHAASVGGVGRSLMISGDLRHAEVFENPSPGTVRHRQLSCSFTPDAPVPDLVYAQPGTMRSEP